MLSYNKKYPIHSEMMISTCSTGRTTSSILPLMRVIATQSGGNFSMRMRKSEIESVGLTVGETVGVNNLLSLVNDVGHVNLKDSKSECRSYQYCCTSKSEIQVLTPMTFLAPALAANMHRIPVPHPTSRTTLSLQNPFRSGTFQRRRNIAKTHLKRCLFHHILFL